MPLSLTVTSILQTLERVSSIPVEVLPDPSLRVPGKVQMARAGAKSHVATYNPNLATAEYYVAFEAAFVLRLYETPPERRVLFAGTGEGMGELERLPLTAPLTRVPPPARRQFQTQLHDGLLTQLRSQPIGMKVNEWLLKHQPDLREQQLQGIAEEQRQAAQTLSPEIRSLSPAKVWEASIRMNAAVALFTDQLVGERRYAVPFEAAGVEAAGRDLLALVDTLGPEPEFDRERVDRWATALGLKAWYRWVPVQ